MRKPLRYRMVALLAGTLSAFGQYAEIPAARVKQIALLLPDRPAGLGTPCASRAAWEPLAANLHESVSAATALLTRPFPAWDDDAYLEFSRKGVRPLGEAMLRARQGELTPLVLAECAEYRGRFLGRIALVLDQLAAQKSWTLPAHDGRLDSFSGKQYFIELNSANLAHTIAETLYLLGDKLPQATRDRTMKALEQRAFQPLRESFATGRGNAWLRRTDNWNSVCVKGVTGAALTVLADRSDRALFAAAAEHYSSYYLKGFGEDGYGLEGIGYWDYGFSNFAELREQLLRATRGKVDLFRDPRTRRAALFGAQFQMLPGNYADFGDARFLSRPGAELLEYLGRVFGFAPEGGGAPPRVGSGPGSLTSFVRASFPSPLSVLEQPGSRAEILGLRTYYPEARVLVSRPGGAGRLAVTIKAGGNGSHSHNDIGSFSIGLGNTQPLGDPGGPYFYTSRTFTAERYESRLLNSFGHPVPVVAGRLQLEATKVHAPVLKMDFTDLEDAFAIDLTKAYDAPELRRLTRRMRHSRAGRGTVEVEDEFELNGAADIEEGLPTHGIWKRVDAQTLEFALSGERLRVTVTAPGPFEVTEDRIDEYGNPFTRVGLRFHLKESGKIRLRFTPVE